VGWPGLRRPRLRGILVLVGILALIVLLSGAVNTYAAQAFIVPSLSMSPTLQIGDRLIVDKLDSTIHRGDIIVFRRPPGDSDSDYPILAKRVIGLPGETISSQGNTILINGSPLAEPWLPKLTGICYQSAANVLAIRIPAHQYYVMGDCRGDSIDSRFWGTVPVSDIIGKVTVVVWRHNHPWVHWF
jgi:signal peptidase I